jgi:nucleoside 2-deoxyribosyltransferase
MADHVPYESRPLVYVAAPYTRPDPVKNTNKAIRVAAELVDEGVVTPFVPHLTLLWHLVDPRPLDFWYEYDVATLARCDAVLRLPGDSTGADREVAYAERKGIPVFTERDDLFKWAQSRLKA